jgi:hypothetical protein
MKIIAIVTVNGRDASTLDNPKSGAASSSWRAFEKTLHA